MNTSETTPAFNIREATPQLRSKILATIEAKSFCTIATVSPKGFPHSAGVVYEAVDGCLWFHTLRTTRKARNIAENPKLGVCIPFRRLPVGPPFTIQFQAKAELIDMDGPEASALLAAGRLKSITGHGELEMPDGCFVRIEPRGKIHSFGPGARIIDLIRDPLGTGARVFSLDDPTSATTA